MSLPWYMRNAYIQHERYLAKYMFSLRRLGYLVGWKQKSRKARATTYNPLDWDKRKYTITTNNIFLRML